MKRTLFYVVAILFFAGCTKTKIKEVDYCSEHPDAPECKVPQDPCELYPDLCLELVSVCESYPDMKICEYLKPEKICEKHPEWSICKPLPPNYPPVITLSVSSTCGQYPDVITIDVSQSNDPEGDVLSFKYELFSGKGRFVSPVTSPLVFFELPFEEGDIIIKLTVSDGRGGEAQEFINLRSLGHAVFVSPSGDDSNSGRFDEPVSSVYQALSLAHSKGITDIKFLEGEYEGGIALQYGGIRLIGGYYEEGGCWSRDYENHWTVVNGKNFDSSASYVFSLTSQVKMPVVFDGIYLIGTTSASLSGTTSLYAALIVDGAYSVEVTNCFIYGGEGNRTRGIYGNNVNSVSLVNTRVDGGKSTSHSQNIGNRGGVILKGADSVLIEGSIIYGGEVTGTLSQYPWIVGLYLENITKCSVENSLIFGGKGFNSNQNYPPYSVGLYLNSSCAVIHNYIYGGDPLPSTTALGESYGVYFSDCNPTEGVKVINNIIHPGGAYLVGSSLKAYGIHDTSYNFLYECATITPSYLLKSNNIFAPFPFHVYAYEDSGGWHYYLSVEEVNSLDGSGGNFDGNLSMDPILDLDGIHLSPVSPMIDAGYPGSTTEVLPPFDIDGDPRPTGNYPDIGPDEAK